VEPASTTDAINGVPTKRSRESSVTQLEGKSGKRWEEVEAVRNTEQQVIDAVGEETQPYMACIWKRPTKCEPHNQEEFCNEYWWTE
jgi:hypothetical protein